MYRDSRRIRLALALLVAVSFTLITVDYRAGQGTSMRWLRSAAATVFGPVARAVTSVVRPVGNALSTIGDLGGLRDDNARLSDENTTLREQLRETESLRRQADDMSKLLGLSARGGYKIVAARVVALGPGNFEWTATIDVGRRDGVREGHTVVNGDGLVGRIVEVGPYTAQVLLAIDPTFTVAARMARSGEIGAASGRGLQPMQLELLRPEAKVGKSEAVVTKSVPGGFVGGVPIGVATKTVRARTALTATVQVAPFVNFTALDAVGVIVQAPRDTGRTALAPTPSATPPPSPSPSCRPASPASSPSPSASPAPACPAAGSPATRPSPTTSPSRSP